MTARTRGVVAAGAPDTAAAGARMLEAGGNAIDAVCAAAFAAFVVEGLLCGPAGGGAALVADRDRGARVLDFFAAVPGLGLPAGVREDFRVVDVDFGPTVQQFHVGRAAAAVPGALDGIVRLHADGGRLPLSEIVAPAVEAGRAGFEVGAPMAYVTEILAPIVALSAPVTRWFRPGARPIVAGTRLANPDLADTLEALGRDGGPATLAAFHADLLADFGPDAGGGITRDDLSTYAPIWREPARVAIGDDAFVSNPPPSSGGTLVALGLRGAVGDRLRADGFLGPAHVVHTAELLRGLDRVRAGGYDDDVRRADATARWLGPSGLEALRRACVSQPGDLGSTTHISVLTDDGALASLTMSNGEGCGHGLATRGIHVNNFLGEADINPGGFHRRPAGERMTTMMAPSAVLGPNGPRLVLGRGGSNRIRSAILQVLLGVLVHGRRLVEAIEAPRLHVEGTRLWFEGQGLPAASEAALRSAWTDAVRFDTPNLFFGGVHAVARDPTGLHGAGDPRRGGVVATVT